MRYVCVVKADLDSGGGSMDAATGGSVSVKYKSPRHAQVWFLERSRRTWKRKYAALKVEQKRWQNRAADRCRARDEWRRRAETAEQRVRELEADNAARTQPVAASPKKKNGLRGPKMRRRRGGMVMD